MSLSFIQRSFGKRSDVHFYRIAPFQCLLAVVCFLINTSTTVAQPSSDESTVRIGTQVVSLQPPTLEDAAASAADQQASIKPLLRGISWRQFTRDSVVAPVRIQLKYIKDDAGERLGHDVHVAFVVHTSLKEFLSDRFDNKWLNDLPEGKQSIDQNVMDLTQDELRQKGIETTQEHVRYKRIQFELMEQVTLNGVLKFQRQSSENRFRVDIDLAPEFQATWSPAGNKAESNPYSGFRGWLIATELDGMEAMIMEARFVLHEPADWFSGANFLRSKLPLILQEVARDLRRKL